MEDMMRERIQQSWKIQTFQYDYLAHLKGRFIFCHFLLFAFSWILMCVLHDSLLLTQIMCMASWDYFMLRRIWDLRHSPVSPQDVVQ